MSEKLIKKVISFSLYGNKDFYCLGLIENIDIINEKYKDWNIYVFYNNIPEKILHILKNKANTYLYECISKGYNWEGMFWRFYPFQFKSIDIFLSRDADSRITDREMNLVNIWINSDKAFHMIRDHPQHVIPILGGMFGVKNKIFRNENIIINNFISKYYTKYKNNQERGPDQYFLNEYIYPIIKNNNMTHISYESLRKSPNDILIDPNPTDFIGMLISPSIDLNSTDSKIIE